MTNIKSILKEGVTGLHYGNRVLLPFRVHVLKAVIEKDIIMDFSKVKGQAEYKITDDYTEIYFHNYKIIIDTMAKYETVKLIIVEDGDDIFDFSHHLKIGLHFRENHILEIENIDGDVLFIE